MVIFEIQSADGGRAILGYFIVISGGRRAHAKEASSIRRPSMRARCSGFRGAWNPGSLIGRPYVLWRMDSRSYPSISDGFLVSWGRHFDRLARGEAG
jgi:hypothetical protein